METQTLAHFTPFHMTTPDIDAAPTPQTFLKMEDLQASSPSASAAHLTQSSPAPVIVHSKPAKKRKSWGQELPEPKTNLPPRKRAKTDDEKEQRRIERIKRNRAAAHNSRERKRQETETLAVALARANAELEAYRNLHGPLPASVVLPEVTLLCAEEPDTPTPSLVDSHGTYDERSHSPASPSLSGESWIKQEPTESLALTLPPTFNLNEKSATPPSSFDLTQHSAAMLCDLQCQSKEPRRAPSSFPTTWWTPLFLYLMNLQLRTCYQTILLAMWSLSPSRMARWMPASTRRSTSPLTTSSMTPLLLRSMAMAQLNAATSQPNPQSALLALQRQSRMGLAKDFQSDAAAMQATLLQRKASDRSHCPDSESESTRESRKLGGV